MARPLTGRAAYRRGRWIARIVLHREPRAAGGDYRVAQTDVLDRAGARVTTKGAAEAAHARRFAERLQALYDAGAHGRSFAPQAHPLQRTRIGRH